MQATSIETYFLTFHSPQVFSPVFIRAPESPDTLTQQSDSLSADFTLDTVQRARVLQLQREDLLEINYEPTKRPWSHEEDQLLLHSRDERGMEWEEIAKLIPHRNPKMCYNRYKRILEQNKHTWKKKHDDRLRQLVREMGEDWKEIEKHFKHWNARQVKEHYDYYLRPNLDGKAWTIEEDLQLIEFVNSYGKDWPRSQEHFPSKSLSHIKNRFYGRLLKLHEKKMERKSQQSC